MSNPQIAAIRDSINKALRELDENVIDNVLDSIPFPTMHHETVDGLPSASSLGKCPRKKWYERNKIKPTNESSKDLRHLFSQGILTGAYVADAIDRSIDFVHVEKEVFYQTKLFTGTIDIMAKYHFGGTRIVIEVKDTIQTTVQMSYIFQTIAYMKASEAACGFIIMTNRYGWQIFDISFDIPTNSWIVSGEYADTEPHKLISVSNDRFLHEVGVHSAYLHLKSLTSLSNQDAIHWKSSAMTELEPHRGECMSIKSQPHIYKTNRGDYQKGEVRPGRAEILCPFAGMCFPGLEGKSNIAIELIKGETTPYYPVLTPEEEPF